MRKHSTHFLIHAYFSYPFGDTNLHDEKWFSRVRAELERRGIISVTSKGDTWNFDKMYREELTGLEADMRVVHEMVGDFRFNLDQYLSLGQLEILRRRKVKEAAQN